MTTSQSHTYIRCGNQIFRGIHDRWEKIHAFQDEARAKRWARDQDKKRPGSVETRELPPITVKGRVLVEHEVRRYLARKNEIARLTREQAADQRNDQRRATTPGGLTGKTAKLVQSHVATDQGGSSFLRGRSKKRQVSRNARNTRASFGVS